MHKKKRLYLIIAIGSLALILGFITWFMIVPFEGEKPSIKIEPLQEFLSGTQKFTLTATDMKRETISKRLWEGASLSHKNAATTARFADRRLYYYKGKKIDEQVHLGVDLASLVNSEVQAANNGRVIFADCLGIYGVTIILDHGQGLASTYSHLSKKVIEVGQEVKKGEVIGLTGQTGLAGGDHLHFGIMIGGVLVNPIEWWDPHWVQDNITKKLALLNR